MGSNSNAQNRDPSATPQLASHLPSYKQAELGLYSKIYGTGFDMEDSSSHGGLLRASEGFFLRRLKELSTSAEVLEIGCGAGRHSIYCAQSGARSVTGIDLSPEAIEVARQAAGKFKSNCPLNFLQMDSEKLEFADCSFDLIVNHEVFSSIDLTQAVGELARVLRPGGKILAIECLGHNPIFNLNRKINVLLGKRTAWSVAHILKEADLNLLRSNFSGVEVNYFHLFLVLLAPFLKLCPSALRNRIIASLEGLDASVLNTWPRFRALAFKAVIEATSNQAR